MDESLQIEVLDLGDAKEVTKGPYTLMKDEDHPQLIYRVTP